METARKPQISLKSSLAWIGLTAAGYLANVFAVPLFFNVDFLFGSVFALIVLHYLGLGPALVSALVIASHTAVLWNHPYAIVIMTLEVFLVGVVYKRKSDNLMLLDTMFWIAVGMPLVLLFYGGIMGIAAQSIALVAFKQAINGIVNALIASIIIGILRHNWPHLDSSNRRAPFGFSQAIFLMMVAFVLLPALAILVVTARSEMDRVETDVTSKLEVTTFSARQSINAWVTENLQTLHSLATYVNVDNPSTLELLRDEMALLNMSDSDFSTLAVVDPLGRLIAGEPATQADNLLADPSLAQWPYFARIVTGLSGVASNVIRVEEQDVVFLGVPIVRNDTMYGAVLGLVDVDRLREELFRVSGRWMLDATLVDGSQRVVATTHSSIESFADFSDRMPRESEHESGNLFLRSPEAGVRRSVMERWQESEYIAIDRIGANASWILVLQAPIAPYQDTLNERYRAMLLVMLVVVVVTIFLSSALSRKLLGSLSRLTEVSKDLPAKVTSQQSIDWPTSRINEIDTLIESFRVTSVHLGDSFQQLQTANEELSEAKLRAESASRTKSEFLANISHDLRTPLNGILGYAQILARDESIDQKTRDAVTIIERSGTHLLNLINDILDVSRIEAKRLTLEPDAIAIASFLDDIADIVTLQARAKGLVLDTEFTDLPAAVLGDEKRLRQVLLNLLNNAVKFTDSGAIWFVARPSADRMRFEVRDTGSGIPDDQVTEIFSPFKQLEKHVQSEDGTGLGLAIVHRLVEMMGGEVHVDSVLGEGSTFWFEIELPETDEMPDAAPASNSITGYEGPRKTVLVVDDKAENRGVARAMLEPLGFAVIEAEDGQSGVSAVAELHPDVVLMDLVMPVLDGFDAVREIRSAENGTHVPVIAVSASVAEAIRTECLRVGFTEFLPKPFRQPDLLETIRRVTELTWRHSAPKIAVEEHDPGSILVPDGLLSGINEAVQTGNVKRIVEAADELARTHAEYAAPARWIGSLAQQFRMNELAAYVQKICEPAGVAHE